MNANVDLKAIFGVIWDMTSAYEANKGHHPKHDDMALLIHDVTWQQFKNEDIGYGGFISPEASTIVGMPVITSTELPPQGVYMVMSSNSPLVNYPKGAKKHPKPKAKKVAEKKPDKSEIAPGWDLLKNPLTDDSPWTVTGGGALKVGTYNVKVGGQNVTLPYDATPGEFQYAAAKSLPTTKSSGFGSEYGYGGKSMGLFQQNDTAWNYGGVGQSPGPYKGVSHAMVQLVENAAFLGKQYLPHTQSVTLHGKTYSVKMMNSGTNYGSKTFYELLGATHPAYLEGTKWLLHNGNSLDLTPWGMRYYPNEWAEEEMKSLLTTVMGLGGPNGPGTHVHHGKTYQIYKQTPGWIACKRPVIDQPFIDLVNTQMAKLSKVHHSPNPYLKPKDQLKGALESFQGDSAVKALLDEANALAPKEPLPDDALACICLNSAMSAKCPKHGLKYKLMHHDVVEEMSEEKHGNLVNQVTGALKPKFCKHGNSLNKKCPGCLEELVKFNEAFNEKVKGLPLLATEDDDDDDDYDLDDDHPW